MTTQTFDGSIITILPVGDAFEVTVNELGVELTLVSNRRNSLATDAIWNTASMLRAGCVDAWTASRLVFCFELADRTIARAA